MKCFLSRRNGNHCRWMKWSHKGVFLGPDVWEEVEVVGMGEVEGGRMVVVVGYQCLEEVG